MRDEIIKKSRNKSSKHKKHTRAREKKNMIFVCRAQGCETHSTLRLLSLRENDANGTKMTFELHRRRMANESVWSVRTKTIFVKCHVRDISLFNDKFNIENVYEAKCLYSLTRARSSRQ